MKKSVTLIPFLLVLAMLKTQGQDYLISFSGTGATSEVGAVRVENLSSGDTLILNGSDVLHLLPNVGINDANIGNKSMKIYPNPLVEKSLMTLVTQVEGYSFISIADLTGRIVCQTIISLSAGIHCFRISGISRGMYLVTAVGNNYSITSKMISKSDEPNNAEIQYISYIHPIKSSLLKRTEIIVDMKYNIGDQLLFKGISGIYSTIVTDVPASSKTITFSFVECTDNDGNNYETVQIGAGKSVQTWMAENLNVGIKIDGVQEQTNNGIIEKYCYNDDINNCNVYGGMYQWNEMMKYQTNPITQGICPDGWHLPSDAETTVLTDYLGGQSFAGGKMKEAGTAHWLSPNTGATNSSGFSALPAGYRGNSGNFNHLNLYAEFWSSTETSSIDARSWHLYYEDEFVGRGGLNKTNGISVRCVKD